MKFLKTDKVTDNLVDFEPLCMGNLAAYYKPKHQFFSKFWYYLCIIILNPNMMSQYEETFYSSFGNHSIDDPIKGSLEFIDRSY